MWPMLLVTAIIVILAVWAVLRIRRAQGPDAVVETGIDAVLFWGAWVVVVGLLGTFVGIYLAAGFIEQAGSTNPSLVWGGIKVALIPTLFGLLVFSVESRQAVTTRRRYPTRSAGAGRATGTS
jgi:uncharacterized membrane protein